MKDVYGVRSEMNFWKGKKVGARKECYRKSVGLAFFVRQKKKKNQEKSPKVQE